MKLLAKAALGALMLAGATAMTAAPAQARVTVGLEFGGGGYRLPAYCDPYSRWYDPYRCDDTDDGYDYYNGPVFIDGIWLDSGFRSRFHGGHREFYYHDGWHGGSGFHGGGFHHGGWGGGFGGGHGGGGHGGWGGHGHHH